MTAERLGWAMAIALSILISLILGYYGLAPAGAGGLAGLWMELKRDQSGTDGEER